MLNVDNFEQLLTLLIELKIDSELIDKELMVTME